MFFVAKRDERRWRSWSPLAPLSGIPGLLLGNEHFGLGAWKIREAKVETKTIQNILKFEALYT
jgi:hypothetical protein